MLELALHNFVNYVYLVEISEAGTDGRIPMRFYFIFQNRRLCLNYRFVERFHKEKENDLETKE